MKLAERIFRRKDYYITSPFGTRKDPISGVTKQHNGCDYGTNLENWEQYALEDGEVIAIQTGIKDKDTKGGYGNYVKVKYPRLGIQLLHAHLKEVKVKNGQKVDKNTILGLTGTSGYSTGIHLHLGLQKIGSSTWLDPEQYDYIEGGEIMNFKVGDIVYALENIKLYTTIEHLENKYTLKKNEKAYVRYIKGNEVALANPETKEYFESAWTGELNKLTTEEPMSIYKELYEKELLVNKDLQAQLDIANKKIADAMNILK